MQPHTIAAADLCEILHFRAKLQGLRLIVRATHHNGPGAGIHPVHRRHHFTRGGDNHRRFGLWRGAANQRQKRQGKNGALAEAPREG